MKLNKIAIVGGGPGGLYAARLLGLSQPQAQVDVYERGAEGETFGFGVGLAAGTQRNLGVADPESLQAISDAGWTHDMSLRVGDRVAELPTVEGGRSIARTALLEVLAQYATEAGAVIHYGSRVQAWDLEADLVVVADGASSASRERLNDELGVTKTTGRSLYLWCGTDFALPRGLFSAVKTEHGTFTTHAYPYCEDRSTFLVETDEKTWLQAGFDKTTAAVAADESDEVSLRYLERAFAAELDGHRLIGNRTRWLRFRTIRAQKWFHGNTVFLGDAVHTAHYSIGSGTKLAMEDAIALDTSLTQNDSLPEALSQYQQLRTPSVEHLQSVAKRSAGWWETFPERTHRPVDTLLMSFMTRAGKVSIEQFHATTPKPVIAALAEYAHTDTESVPSDGLVDWVLSRPAAVAGREFATPIVEREMFDTDHVRVVTPLVTDAWSVDGDEYVAQLVGETPESDVLWITGATTRDQLLTNLNVAERVQLASDLVVVVEGPEEYRADMAAGLVSMRTPLVAVTQSDIVPDRSRIMAPVAARG